MGIKKLIFVVILFVFFPLIKGMQWKTENTEYDELIAYKFVGDLEPLPYPPLEEQIFPVAIPQRKEYSLDDCSKIDPKINVKKLFFFLILKFFCKS